MEILISVAVILSALVLFMAMATLLFGNLFFFLVEKACRFVLRRKGITPQNQDSPYPYLEEAARL